MKYEVIYHKDSIMPADEDGMITPEVNRVVTPSEVAEMLGTAKGKCNFMLLPGGDLRLRVFIGSEYQFFPLDSGHYIARPIVEFGEGQDQIYKTVRTTFPARGWAAGNAEPDYPLMVKRMLPFLEEYNHSSQFHKCADPECLVCKELGMRHAELKAVLAEARACTK